MKSPVKKRLTLYRRHPSRSGGPLLLQRPLVRASHHGPCAGSAS